MNETLLIEAAGRLLGQRADTWTDHPVQVRLLVPDGSSRRFYHLRAQDGQTLVAMLPPENDPIGLVEARAFVHIGHHLCLAGAPTPHIHAFDPATGLVLCEDLGDLRLHDLVAARGAAQATALYDQAVRALARMQVRAAAGFDPNWCWDSPRYDRQLMRERESGYFLRACCTDLLGLHFDQAAVEIECGRLADAAAAAPADFFLHRDFQSRNLMVQDGQIRFLDFQGGRLGPLAYDLASLLLDPYATLPAAQQGRLIDVYLAALREEIDYDPEQFRQEYLWLALQRNLQILGAFAFLSQVRRKPFFARFLQPALESLAGLLAKPEAAGYPALRNLTDQCRQELAIRS